MLSKKNIIQRTSWLFVAFLAVLFLQSCKQKTEKTDKGVSIITLDSTKIQPFFETYPDIQKYQDEIADIYEHYEYHYIWFDENGMTNYAESLYDRVKNLEDEGIYESFPYQDKIDEIHSSDIKNPEENPDGELLMTGLYTFYLHHVYKGIEPKVSQDLGWLLPRKDMDDTALLDSIITEENWDENDSLMFGQYYRMRDKLKKYRKIQDEGGWEKIEMGNKKTLEPNDTSEAVRQIRKRLYISGELKKDNESDVYDEELKDAFVAFQKRHGFNRDSIIALEHIEALNVPVKEYVKKLVVNMERFRWIPAEMNNSDEFIFVNIPAYHLDYYRDGKVIFESNVIVGGVMHKTVIFDGEMSYLAFSPYWNIPQSIVNNEIKPGMEKDDKYLEKRNMEWNNGQVRQLPGGNNSLGLVKFMFPNENNIYLHDTPAKSLFKDEDRARSHGCIRVENARDLAVTILNEDEEWTPEKIDKAMNAGKESTYSLKQKIPVYIGYFTVWVNDDGELNFYKDVYKRDDKLADLLLFK